MRGKSLSRLKEMYHRQDPFRFLADYVPATKAIPSEAPPKSRPSQVYAPELGRNIHNLSTAEKACSCLARYHPSVVDIHEQNLLWPTTHEHPLSARYPEASTQYEPFRGTLEVADRLGYLDLHPVLTIRKGAKRSFVPWPYQGDQLLFLETEDGPYCVNWTVKDKPKAFTDPPPGPKAKEVSGQLRLIARHEIESEYYKDVEIRTQRVTKEELHPEMASNLIKLCLYAGIVTGLEKEQIIELEAALIQGIATETPPAVTIARFVIMGRCSLEQGRVIFYQAIWHRRLRVDLFSTILIDRPVALEERDVLEVYADWFER